MEVLGIFNYGLVLLYGLFLSVFIAGGWESGRQKRIVWMLCPVLLLVQSLCWLLLGENVVRKLYPLIVHLPLVLILVLVLRKELGVAAVSVFTGYLCCQLPRWVRIFVNAVTGLPLAGELAYTLAIGPLFVLLLRRFAEPAHQAMTRSRQSLLLFGGLPAAYYVFDYGTSIYSNLLYAGIPALNELIPTAVILFYVLFLTAYHQETVKLTKAELENAVQRSLFRQSQREIETLRQAQLQASVLRHDLRHHLNVIDGFLEAGKTDQALSYIRSARSDIAAMAITRYCEHETVNLICSSFAEKARQQNIAFRMEAQLPETLPISDTELCALLSNGLENALKAAGALPEGDRWVRCRLGNRREKLLMEIRNPYVGTVAIEDGIPTSGEAGHGFGCRSICAIVRQHGGLYTFQPENGIFTLQIAIPAERK